MDTVEYAHGRLVDLFGEPPGRTALLWHGKQPGARTAIRPLAERVAAHGLQVVVPDWNSQSAWPTWSAWPGRSWFPTRSAESNRAPGCPATGAARSRLDRRGHL
ncbi:hypothetical protein [Mycolicibacter kumamotonensis]|uniref:hypothetical protein n=1 Tax=Mycolicibacter kumamotonensis TaxID=354243 RepID=UPI003F6AD733